MEKLCDILRRRTAIEASMVATSKKVDDAFTLAEKAFACALGRRLQSLKGHQSVRGSKVMCTRASVDPMNRRSQHDLNPQRKVNIHGTNACAKILHLLLEEWIRSLVALTW